MTITYHIIATICWPYSKYVKIAEGRLNFYLALSFLFLLSFLFSICFSILEWGLGLSDKDHTVTWQVTSDDTVTSHITQRGT